MQRHPVFYKYSREYLHDVTGYSRIYLGRVDSGRVPLSLSFVERVSFKLNEPAERLFLLDALGVLAGSGQNHS